MKTSIFVSYGHDEFTEKVKVIIKSLNGRKEYQIWWDGDLKKSADWVKQIEENLDELVKSKPDSCFIYIVTPYSTSDERYNFCINEILRALEGRVRILPIRLSSAPMPLPIGSIQWFDLTQCEIDLDSKDFQNRLESLCSLIDSRDPIKINGKQGTLHKLLNPCLFTLDIDKHLQYYCPRNWMFEATLDWLDNRKERMLLIEGGPGTGKTAFSLWIATRKLPERIHAWHLCQYNDVNTRSLLTCVKSLTWYLASRLPYFYDSLELSKVEDLIQGGEENSGTILKELILMNLNETHVKGEKIVILIDALDEASENGVNKVAETLAQYIDEMPEWLRFIITTRNDSSVTVPLKDVSYVIDLDEPSNHENCVSDISAYVKANVDESTFLQHNNIVDVITERSGNVILFAKLMCDAIAKGEKIDLIQLPKGLISYYDCHMTRYFGSKSKYDYETHALPIIQIMLASYQPIKREYIYQRIHETEEWCKDKTKFRRVLNSFGPLLKESEEYILPFHKSLSDWFIDSGNQRYYASREDGLDKMCDWGFDVLSDEFSEEDLQYHFYTYQPQYLIDAKKHKELVQVYSDCVFWERRREVLGVDFMLQRMFSELPMMKENARNKIIKSLGFRDVLYLLSEDLFNKGLFIQLKKIGYTVQLSEPICDKDRLLALKFYYINGDYTSVKNHLELFSRNYDDKNMDPIVQNILGLVTKKCGLIAKSAEFFKQSISQSTKYNVGVDRLPFYYLNLSRIYTILCQFSEGRQKLSDAENAFHNRDWESSVELSCIAFVSRQIELAIRYVKLETELYSESINEKVCDEELAWADNLYSSKLYVDRYYPRHLQSKILFLLRKHRLAEIDSIWEELEKYQGSGYDNIRYRYLYALYKYVTGHNEEGLEIIQKLIDDIEQMNILLIEKTECFALLDTFEGQCHLAEISDELKPWYQHMKRITEIISDFPVRNMGKANT